MTSRKSFKFADITFVSNIKNVYSKIHCWNPFGDPRWWDPSLVRTVTSISGWTDRQSILCGQYPSARYGRGVKTKWLCGVWWPHYTSWVPISGVWPHSKDQEETKNYLAYPDHNRAGRSEHQANRPTKHHSHRTRPLCWESRDWMCNVTWSKT